jgi:hypothetical protein
MKKHINEKEVGILYIPKFREYGIRIIDGGDSFQLINFCPWCGEKLPDSLREEWFAEIENLKLEPDSECIPSKYLNEEWWKKTNV